MMAASWCFQSVSEQDLDKVLNNQSIGTKTIQAMPSSAIAHNRIANHAPHLQVVLDVHHSNILLCCLDRLEENATGKVDKATNRKCLFCFRRSTESK